MSFLAPLDCSDRRSREHFWQQLGGHFVGAQVSPSAWNRESELRIPVARWIVTFDAYNTAGAGGFGAGGIAVAIVARAMGWRTRARVEFRDASRLRFTLKQKLGEGVMDDFAHLRGGERSAVFSFSGAPANKSFVLKSNNSSVTRQLLQQPAARNALLNLYPPLFTIRAPSLIVPLLPPPLRARYGSERHTLHLECGEFVRDPRRLSAICGLFATLLPRLEAAL